ncbi:MAG: methyl-accepting chemotaxis protein, partial [Deltaproteobacteria bacterium]
LEKYAGRTTTLYYTVLWAYPVFREAEALGMYLQTEDHEEQQAMYKRFEEYGAEFARISGEIKKYGNSPEEAKRIAEIEEMQKRILSEAVNLIAIRDGEGAYGPDTKAASAKFEQTAREFVTSIEKLVSVENKLMKAIQEESSGIAAGIRSSIGRSTKIMILVSILALAAGALVSFGLSMFVSEYIRKAVGITADVSSGDLTKRLSVNSRDESGQIAEAFNTMIDNLSDITCKIKSSVNHLSSSAGDLVQSADRISDGVDAQNAKMSKISNATQEMAAATAEVSRNTEAVSGAAGKASELAKKGGKTVIKTIDSMNLIANTTRESSRVISSLGERSNQIGSIIRVINDIADQTNLLALNAAIESARAGVHGRGFAVVADEVRKLAERTIKATKEISEMIKAIQEDTKLALSTMRNEVKVVENGVSQAKEGGEALEEISKQVDIVTDMIKQVVAASERHTGAAGIISADMTEMAGISHGASNNVKRIAFVSENISRLAAELKEIADVFRVAESNAGTDPCAVTAALPKQRLVALN